MSKTYMFILAFILSWQTQQIVSACSTFKLQKADSLVYGHNLNEGDIGVPGLIFINKREVYKTGRSWSEISTKEKLNASDFCWISRYGSVTFNGFACDFPDGGMNEEGLFIWEMNEEIEYPKIDSLPKLNQMHWMQYILDNCSTTEQALHCAYDFEIDGWGWHYFIGDKYGNTAAVAFIDGKVVINEGKDMPVPGLFNTPYSRELELLKYYQGFGGDYEPTLTDPKVPRFAKTAVLTRDYKCSQSVVDYGLKMLEFLTVNDVPEWSILFDVKKRNIYFKTRVNPSIKSFSMNQVDFSNTTPTMILNIDIKNGGDVFDQFEIYSNEKMESFLKNLLLPILPAGFFTRGGITLDEYVQRASTHTDLAKMEEKQFFKGTWKNSPDKAKEEISIVLEIESSGAAISGKISLGKEFYPLDHFQLEPKKLIFTFKTARNTFFEVQALIKDGQMTAQLLGIEDNYGTYILHKE